MKRLGVLASLLAALSLLAQATVAATVQQIEVRLFFAHIGTFSEPISESATLWNAVTGEVGFREPSSSTMVKVLVTASPRTYDMKGKVQLAVREKNGRWKNIMVKGLGAFGPDGRQYFAFWLPETGCDELYLEASVRGSPIKVKHTVPFRCGE